ncbi:hypothetical protein [Desulfatitalea alkaliphila]|uniref:Uncharacterized protein n=1 Tax=Desulfatitalea alkaliphila TaxID=2929485 RepID=A0AA41UN04_9BACT|nr:hypothetical protein [Desulfatitalea alkaliphila]MCJ8503221.1 hypothetical protein [Desulfatitalea alkaliphila]
MTTDFKIGPMAITHQMGTCIDMAVNDRLQCGSLFIFNGNGPHGAMALNSDQYSLFGGAFATFMGNPWHWLRNAANVLFIKLIIAEFENLSVFPKYFKLSIKHWKSERCRLCGAGEHKPRLMIKHCSRRQPTAGCWPPCMPQISYT